MRMAAGAILVLATCSVAPIGATTYLVLPDGSGDFPTINAAVDACVAGDIIELGDGVFRGDGNRWIYVDKELFIQSASGDPEQCIIDCEGGPESYRRGFTIVTGSPETTALRGIKVANGFDEILGGGVYCSQASPTFENCIFADCTAEFSVGGGGVYCQLGSPVFIDCRFERNTAAVGGGGIYVIYSGSVRFERCVFSENAAGTGGGCRIDDTESAQLVDCVFWGNTAVGGQLSRASGRKWKWRVAPSRTTQVPAMRRCASPALR
jgi:predicted outer membrane repeat protein